MPQQQQLRSQNGSSSVGRAKNRKVVTSSGVPGGSSRWIQTWETTVQVWEHARVLFISIPHFRTDINSSFFRLPASQRTQYLCYEGNVPLTLPLKAQLLMQKSPNSSHPPQDEGTDSISMHWSTARLCGADETWLLTEAVFHPSSHLGLNYLICSATHRLSR